MDTPNSVVFPSFPDAAVAATTGAHGSTEVPGKATRRRFMLSYKRKMVALAAGLPAGETGALLRREGLYSSHLTHWRRQVAAWAHRAARDQTKIETLSAIDQTPSPRAQRTTTSWASLMLKSVPFVPDTFL